MTTLDDELDSSASNATITDMGGLGDLSLREALFLAQQDPTSVDDITFASSIVGGVTPDDNGEIVLTQGELAVFGSVNIDGDVGTNGTIDITLRADPLNPSAVFHFYQGISTLNGVTVTGGDAGERRRRQRRRLPVRRHRRRHHFELRDLRQYCPVRRRHFGRYRQLAPAR